MSDTFRRWSAEREEGGDEDRLTPTVAPGPAPAAPSPAPRPAAAPGPPDTVIHAEGCRRPGLVRTRVAANGTATRWETRCNGCRRRSFEVVDAAIEKQRAAGLEPGDSWPAEVIPPTLPRLKRYWERPEPPPPASGHRVVGF